jgi:hypothetical protein
LNLSLNNSKENTNFVFERYSKQETNPSKRNKAKVAKNNSKNVNQTVNRARTSLQNLYQIQQANEAKDKQTSEIKCQKDLNQPS